MLTRTSWGLRSLRAGDAYHSSLSCVLYVPEAQGSLSRRATPTTRVRAPGVPSLTVYRGITVGCCIGCILYRSYTSETRCLKAQRSFTAIHRLTLYNLSYATSLLGTPGQHAGASLPRPACGGLPCRHMARLQEKADERLITTHALCFN